MRRVGAANAPANANREDVMQINRKIGYAPKTVAAGREIAAISGCVGCDGCKGLCVALVELMTLPDAVLSRGDEA